jgi:hypothetical protein
VHGGHIDSRASMYMGRAAGLRQPSQPCKLEVTGSTHQTADRLGQLAAPWLGMHSGPARNPTPQRQLLRRAVRPSGSARHAHCMLCRLTRACDAACCLSAVPSRRVPCSPGLRERGADRAGARRRLRRTRRERRRLPLQRLQLAGRQRGAALAAHSLRGLAGARPLPQATACGSLYMDQVLVLAGYHRSRGALMWLWSLCPWRLCCPAETSSSCSRVVWQRSCTE